jgi:hypothetical protein
MGEPNRCSGFEAQKPEQRLGDAQIEPKDYEKMQSVGAILDELLNRDNESLGRKVGFVLMVFPFGDRSGRCDYVSNGADRGDVIKLMKQMIARFEGQPEIQGSS